ncbi:MAG: galactokinase [Bacteroidetes bacterium]|nr:galactokinase [Bacteroidota bacterium]
MIIENIRKTFFELYGKKEIEPVVFFAPGRVNLIGEHTDYNGGFVLPCAIQYGTYLLIRLSNDGMIRLASTNMKEELVISVTDIFAKSPGKWTNYPLGVMDQFLKLGFRMTGMELLFSGDIPNSAGLSSSASIEMVTAFALNELLNCNLDKIALIQLSRRAEHEFAGVNCGIMDQFAVGMCSAGHALFLNCHTLEYKMIPMKMNGYTLIIANTNKPRRLADSKYNERVAECQLAVACLAPYVDISRLGELGYPQFYKLQDKISDEVIRKRARHVVSENQRVLNSVNSLLRNDFVQFGNLMNISHDSLRDDYEVTGIELDTLVDEARKIKGVSGSRMTGAGFGGCTVSLVKNESVDHFIRQVGEAYTLKTGLKADFYLAEIGDSVKKSNGLH